MPSASSGWHAINAEVVVVDERVKIRVRLAQVVEAVAVVAYQVVRNRDQAVVGALGIGRRIGKTPEKLGIGLRVSPGEDGASTGGEVGRIREERFQLGVETAHSVGVIRR